MGIFDRFTRKKEIDSLTSIVENQKKEVESAKEAMYLAEGMVKRAASELRDFREAEEKGWMQLGGQDERELDDNKREKRRKAAIDFYYTTPEGKAIIRNLVNYIIGTGVDYTAQDENPAVQEFLDAFVQAPKVNFDKRQISIVRRTIRDGEVFLHKLFNGDGVCYALRFYPPSEITEIKTDPNDAETVISYHREWSDEKSQTHKEDIPTDQIQHIKWDVDEDIGRGRPMLEPVLKRIGQYEDWLEGRIITNKAKSSIFLDTTVEGGPGKVAAIAATMPGTSKGTFSDDEYAAQVPRYGTRLVHSKSVENKMVEANINASDVQPDGRQILLSIAAGVQFPEYLLTGDASNAAYASTTVAESPFVKAIEAHRLFFEYEFKALFEDIIKRGIQGGKIPSTSTETVLTESARKKVKILKFLGGANLKEQIAAVANEPDATEERIIPTKTGVDFEWPAIITRNVLEETQAVDMWYQNKWISKQTAQMRFGLDPDEERRKIDKEQEESGEDPYAMMQDEIAKLKAQVGKPLGNEE